MTMNHLGNRRVRSVGELLQNQFRIGLSRMERVIKERMTVQDAIDLTPNSLMNIRPVTAAIKRGFWFLSYLSSWTKQTHFLNLLTNVDFLLLDQVVYQEELAPLG